MRKNLNKFFTIFLLVFGLNLMVKAQPMLTVPYYTACPCQTINVTATWNNVSNISYTLFSPGTPPTFFTNNTFPLFNCTPTSSLVTYTLVGAGTYTSAPITNSVTFVLTINPPAPMAISNQTFYCFGDQAVLIAPVGGNSYFVPGIGTSLSNVINISNPSTQNYTVISVIAGCTVTGVTPVNVSPNPAVTITSPTSACQNSTAVLTANMTGGVNYQWFDVFNNAVPAPGGTSPILTLNNMIINQTGTYKVTTDLAWNGLLCPHSATTTVNVVATSPVNVSASPGNIVCQGNNINLSANATGAASYLWSGPQNFVSSSSNPLISPAVPANSGVYSVTANFVSSFLTCKRSNTVSVSVVAIANPVITMSSNVCQGSNVVISATAGAIPQSYSWAGPAFPIGSTNASNILSNAQSNNSGTQFVTVNFGNGCATTASAQLNVVPVNSVSVIPPGKVCSPTNAFLQALATGANLYTWEGPNGFSTPGANVFVYYPTPAASGVYTVTAYFGSGSNLVCTKTETVSLTVYPVLNFSLIPRQEACYNSPITITGPEGATSYSWTSSTGFSANTKDITFPSAQPANSGTYTLNISLGPCNSSGSSEVVILDPITWSLTPQNRTVCRGDTIVLEVGAAGGSENYAYKWNPEIYLQSNNGPVQTSVPLGSVQYNVIVHDIACPNFFITHAFEVNVNQPPIPTMTLSQNEGCAPLCLFYNTNTQNESYVTTFDFGGKLVFQRDSFNYCLKDPGTYSLVVYSTGKNGCSGVFEYPYPLTVRPNPGSDFTWEPSVPSTIDAITFAPSASNGPVVYRNWTFLGGIIPGDTSKTVVNGNSDTTNLKYPTRLYEKFDTYPVLLVQSNENECTDSILKYVKVIDNFQVFVPNTFTPNGDGVNDVFISKGTGMNPNNFSMEIFDRGGHVVFSTKDINEGWDGKDNGTIDKDAVYIYKIKVVGMNGEGRKEFTGYVTILK